MILPLVKTFRHDRYEGKPLYWVEEEVEVEYEKNVSRTREERSQYQVAASAADTMADALEGVSLDMADAAAGKRGHHMDQQQLMERMIITGYTGHKVPKWI